MAKKLYVGNLSYDTSDSDLQRLFEEFGTVQSAQVITDRETGRSKGFGFVEMSSDQEAQAAIQALNGKDHGGRALTVNEAKPRDKRPGGGGVQRRRAALPQRAALLTFDEDTRMTRHLTVLTGASRGLGLWRGDVVITGSLVTSKFPKAGDLVRFEAGQLGAVALHVD